MRTRARRLWPVLIPLVLSFSSADPIRAQAVPPQAGGNPELTLEIALAGGISHLENKTGLSAILEGGLAFDRVRLGLTPVDISWASTDPKPGYTRTYSILGSVICQEEDSLEFVDESYCDDVSARFGAMVDLTVLGFGGPGGLALGGGYRIGPGRGPFLSVSWGLGSNDPSGSWYLQGRVGDGFIQASVGLVFRRG